MTETVAVPTDSVFDPSTIPDSNALLREAVSELLSRMSGQTRQDADAVIDFLREAVARRNIVQVGIPPVMTGFPVLPDWV